MSLNPFVNGNARITRLIIIQLGLAQLAIIISAVQGFLPTLDFLPPVQLKWVAFILAITSITIRAGEMFFNKTATLLKSTDPEIPPVSGSTGNTAQWAKVPEQPKDQR